jgi:hypothetical protein
LEYTIVVFGVDGTPSEPVGFICDIDADAVSIAQLLLLPGQSAEVRCNRRLVAGVMASAAAADA